MALALPKQKRRKSVLLKETRSMCAIRKQKQFDKQDEFILLQLHLPVLQFKMIYSHNVT